jgi:cob(I)alamin adenosyltransferase
MAKIFTKTGDQGETSRLDGIRAPKNDPLIEVYGTIDECNSILGIVRGFNTDPKLEQTLKQLQNMLLLPLPKFENSNVQSLETLIEKLEEKLPMLENFNLPAGGTLSAHLHFARTTARKVERSLATLRETEAVNPAASAWFNRLSDALFVLARVAAHQTGNGDETATLPAKTP